jgi:glutamate dehydrogenase
VAAIESALETGRVFARLHRNSSEDLESADARLSLYSLGAPIPLADLLPILANFGLRVVDEKADEVEPEGHSVWIHDLGVISTFITGIDPSGNDAHRVCDAIVSVWNTEVDNDGFNQLVICAGLTAKQTNVLRFYARHARQLGLSTSVESVAEAFATHPRLAKNLTERFSVMFDPADARTQLERKEAIVGLGEEFVAGLADVPSLEHDRIFRMISTQMDASLRTNAYCSHSRALAVKFETTRIPDAPKPRPRFEIFVSNPLVEGVHLRMGAVARGGLRWSDRPEDFRTEVLGLMKAQSVKNAVIVPAGAKGGFVVRKPTRNADRATQQSEGIACYQTFIGALLDVTDNVIDGVVQAPENVVRWDGDDPYLVVAADKGTATFSDIANQVSLDRHHWLGDAFASGGSVGYDHKAMGITARGAWESVKRHFLRRGIDITAPDATPFSVAGIGDMSGDVFGNGMLLSNKIQLVAAFDHRHIFIDPEPDPILSFNERQRLFRLDRSSWDDYDRSTLSATGGVWPRSAKSIDLSPAACAAIGIAPSENGGPRALAPNEVLRAILTAPVELLWNGGIGTYVKACAETHLQVGDKANDSIRVDATDLRCAIVGEGGNLGVTQRGRIEFAMRLRDDPIGTVGWINSDAIDNSAGVDTSDHEVNLKILLDSLVRTGKLATDERNSFLASLTEDIAQLVLADNIDQNRLLGILYSEGPTMIDLHARYIAHLESAARIDRDLEGLPTADGLLQRKTSHVGLTIPELAVLVAHTKLHITEELVHAQMADEPAFADLLRAYFPKSLNDRLGDAVLQHPLRHEILATVMANRLVNMNGITFVFRMTEESHVSTADIVRAHHAALKLLAADVYWDNISALDGKRPDAEINALLLHADVAVENVTRWFLRNRPLPFNANETIEMFSEVATEIHAGVNKTPDQAVEEFRTATNILDIASITNRGGFDKALVEEVHRSLDNVLHITTIAERVAALPNDQQWDARAAAALRDDLANEHVRLTHSILSTHNSKSPVAGIELVSRWMLTETNPMSHYVDLVNELKRTVETTASLATLSVVVRQLRQLTVKPIEPEN